MNAPERIWASGWDRDPTSHWWHWPQFDGGIEYVRADLHAATLARAERAEKDLAKLTENRDCQLGDNCDLTAAWMAGYEDAKDSAKVKIEQLQFQLNMAMLDAQGQRERATAAELERHGFRERADFAEAELAKAKADLASAAELLKAMAEKASQTP